MDEFFFKPINPQITKHSHISNLQDHIAQRTKDAADLLALPQVENNSCLVCDAISGQIEIFTAHGFPWIECSDCGHHYKKHLPAYESLLKSIIDSTVEIYLNESTDKYRLENITKPKYDFMMKYHMGKPGKWLDLATGVGDMPYLASNEGWTCEATEINQSFIEYARQNYSVTPKALTLDKYYEQFMAAGDEPFDVIGAFGYYDMLPNPTEHMRIQNRLLKMGGLVGINLPNSESLTGAMASLWPDTALRPITHVNYSSFCETSLLKMLELSGFEAVAVLRYGLDIHELITRICEHAPDFLNSRAMHMMYEMFNDLQRTVDNYKYGDQMLWCVRKVKDI